MADRAQEPTTSAVIHAIQQGFMELDCELGDSEVDQLSVVRLVERIEGQLQRQTGLLHQILQNIPHSVFWKDRQSVYLGCNPNFARDVGLDGPEQIAGKTDFDLPTLREESEFYRSIDRRVMEDGREVLNLEETQHRPDGTVATLLTSKVPLRLRNGEVIGVLGIYIDISDRKAAEAELRAARDHLDEQVRDRTAELQESEARWRSFAQTAVDFIIMADRDGRIQYINRVDESAAAEAVSGTSVFDYIPDQYHPVIRETFASVFATGEIASYECQGMGETPGLHWYSTRVGPYYRGDEIVAVTLFVTDITELKKTQDELRRQADELASSQAELQQQASALESILRCIGDGVVVADRDGKFLAFNPAAERLIGKGAIDTGPEGWSESYGLFLADGVTAHPTEDLPLARAMRGEDVKEAELIVKNKQHPSGAILSVTATPLRDTAGGHRGGVAVFRDITQHRQAEDALRESEEQLVAEQHFLKQLLELRERERKLFAHDIHDGFLQEVIGAKMLVDRLAELDGTDVEAFRSNCERASEYLASAIEEGRRLIGELRPLILDERGIVDAVAYLIHDPHFCGGVQFDYTHDVTFARLPAMFEVAVFRLIQEAMTNVRRHSRANRAEIVLGQSGDHLSIEVSDLGVGFDPNSVPTARFGLRGIRERARLFDGKATVKSAPGEGTRVRIQLPIPREQSDA